MTRVAGPAYYARGIQSEHVAASWNHKPRRGPGWFKAGLHARPVIVGAEHHGGCTHRQHEGGKVVQLPPRLQLVSCVS